MESSEQWPHYIFPWLTCHNQRIIGRLQCLKHVPISFEIRFKALVCCVLDLDMPFRPNIIIIIGSTTNRDATPIHIANDRQLRGKSKVPRWADLVGSSSQVRSVPLISLDRSVPQFSLTPPHCPPDEQQVYTHTAASCPSCFMSVSRVASHNLTYWDRNKHVGKRSP